jgi:hypothetical protein
MDILFIEAVAQIVEFMDYSTAMKFTSTCREYYQMRYSRLVIDKYKSLMIDIYRVYRPSDAVFHRYIDTGNKRDEVYCGRCSNIVYKPRMSSHAKKCDSRKMIGLCQYNKPHIQICDCPYNKFECYVCGEYIYSTQYIDHIAQHIYNKVACEHCNMKLAKIEFQKSGIIVLYCLNDHVIHNSRYQSQSKRLVVKWLAKKYLGKMRVTAQKNPDIQYIYHSG